MSFILAIAIIILLVVLLLVYSLVIKVFLDMRRLKNESKNTKTYFFPVVGLPKMQLSNTRLHNDALEYHRSAVEENPNLDSIVLTLGNNIFMYLTSPELT